MELGDTIRYVEQANAGPAAARNTALRVASGELVALLDADDRWKPNRLERCVDILERRPEIGMVTTDANLIEHGVADRRSARTATGAASRSRPTRDEQIDEIARRNFLFVGVVFRRELVERCGDFDERTWGAEDYDLWTRFLLSGTPRRVRQRAARLVPAERGQPELGRPPVGRAPLRAREAPARAVGAGARGRASDIYDIGEKLAASGDRQAGRAVLPARGHRRGCVACRGGVKLAAGALLHLARGARSGADPNDGRAGAQVQPVEPTRG